MMELRKLTRAVEQSPASIVITDLDGKIEYVNPRFSSVTGYSLDEAIGKNPRILKSGETPPDTHRQLWDSLTAGQEWQGGRVHPGVPDQSEFCNRSGMETITSILLI